MTFRNDPWVPKRGDLTKRSDLSRRHRAADPDPDAEPLEERPEGIVVSQRPGRRRADELDEDDGPDLEPPGWARP